MGVLILGVISIVVIVSVVLIVVIKASLKDNKIEEEKASIKLDNQVDKIEFKAENTMPETIMIVNLMNDFVKENEDYFIALAKRDYYQKKLKELPKDMANTVDTYYSHALKANVKMPIIDYYKDEIKYLNQIMLWETEKSPFTSISMGNKKVNEIVKNFPKLKDRTYTDIFGNVNGLSKDGSVLLFYDDLAIFIENYKVKACHISNLKMEIIAKPYQDTLYDSLDVVVSQEIINKNSNAKRGNILYNLIRHSIYIYNFDFSFDVKEARAKEILKDYDDYQKSFDNEIKELDMYQKLLANKDYDTLVKECNNSLNQNSNDFKMWYYLFLASNLDYRGDYHEFENEIAFNKAKSLAKNNEFLKYEDEYNFYKSIMYFKTLRNYFRNIDELNYDANYKMVVNQNKDLFSELKELKEYIKHNPNQLDIIVDRLKLTNSIMNKYSNYVLLDYLTKKEN